MLSMTEQRLRRAKSIAAAGSYARARRKEVLPKHVDVTLSEALVLGLLKLGVTRYVGIFGHGSTDVGEVLRLYQEAGLVRVFPVRHETEAALAAAALNWAKGEPACVFTSIGPGALHALAGSLVAASDGIGVWFLLGDETTEDEGPNMQQIPKQEQGLFMRLFQTLGQAYSLHTPLALSSALRRGHNTVAHPFKAGPFFLLAPMNTQPVVMEGFNLDELPDPVTFELGPCAEDQSYDIAIDALCQAQRVLVKIGGGARGASGPLVEFLDRVSGVCVHTPIATGVVPYGYPGNMTVGGSKGSICGNYAMENADLVLTVGTRFVCQSDSSRTGYPNARKVVSIHPDPGEANHYGETIPLIGDASRVLRQLVHGLDHQRHCPGEVAMAWREDCGTKKGEWEAFKRQRYECPVLFDPMWGREVLTQPFVIHQALEMARKHGAVSFFDAGDVQANGFQIAEDEEPGRTLTETGASYMGFAVSALLATAMSTRPFYAVAFTGDGSFTMNPQILIDGVVHGATGCVLLLDNRRMGAISSLQRAQYGADFATHDHHDVDYVQWAASVKGVLPLFGGYTGDSLAHALKEAFSFQGLSLVHVPVYFGDDPLGGLGAFGRWNVGCWVADTQRLRHETGL